MFNQPANLYIVEADYTMPSKGTFVVATFAHEHDAEFFICARAKAELYRNLRIHRSKIDE